MVSVELNVLHSRRIAPNRLPEPDCEPPDRLEKSLRSPGPIITDSGQRLTIQSANLRRQQQTSLLDCHTGRIQHRAAGGCLISW